MSLYLSRAFVYLIDFGISTEFLYRVLGVEAVTSKYLGGQTKYCQHKIIPVTSDSVTIYKFKVGSPAQRQ
jgi:hypothetical protein